MGKNPQQETRVGEAKGAARCLGALLVRLHLCSLRLRTQADRPASCDLCFRLAAEEGAKEAKGPGSLRVELLDGLYGISESTVVDGIKIA